MRRRRVEKRDAQRVAEAAPIYGLAAQGPGPGEIAAGDGRLSSVRRQISRVLTDQGNEYRAAFDKACVEQGIRHTRTHPRHACTNGFVERLQGTILSELWRTPALRRTQCGASVEFRRRFFTNVAAMQTALDRYLEFYNHRRSHQGYRTQGRTPGEIFFSRGGKRDKRQRLQSVNT